MWPLYSREEPTEYELARQQRIEQNQQVLAELGLAENPLSATAQRRLQQAQREAARAARKQRESRERAEPSRKSRRLAGLEEEHPVHLRHLDGLLKENRGQRAAESAGRPQQPRVPLLADPQQLDQHNFMRCGVQECCNLWQP